MRTTDILCVFTSKKTSTFHSTVYMTLTRRNGSRSFDGATIGTLSTQLAGLDSLRQNRIMGCNFSSTFRSFGLQYIKQQTVYRTQVLELWRYVSSANNQRRGRERTQCWLCSPMPLFSDISLSYVRRSHIVACNDGNNCRVNKCLTLLTGLIDARIPCTRFFFSAADMVFDLSSSTSLGARTLLPLSKK